MPSEENLPDTTESHAAHNHTILHARDILGISVSVATSAEAIEFLDWQFQKGKPTCVSFLNANNSNLVESQPMLASALRGHVIFNDGIGVDIASRILHGSTFPENLNGTDFVPLFLRNTRHVLRIYVLGGRPDVAECAPKKFRELAPQHHYVGSQHGYFGKNEVPEIVDSIIAARADCLIVALGTPQQELWLAENFTATRCRLAFSVGGLLDFVTGTKPRAPLWIRRIHFEWIYRLILEPRRMWRRYVLGSIQFLVRVARAAMAK
jgi:alpha-1,3-mannosyltransferase